VFRCEECDLRTARYAPGWSLFFVDVPDDESEAFTVTYCPDCAQREFGWILRWLLAAKPARKV